MATTAKPLPELVRILSRPVLAQPMRDVALPLLARLDSAQQLAVAQALAQCGVACWVTGHQLTWTPLAQQALQAAAAREMRRTMAATLQMQSLVGTIVAQLGPVVLVFKGWAVEQWAYAPPLVRPCSDIDLLVRPDAQAAVAALLPKLGLRMHHQRVGAAHWLADDTAVDVHSAPIEPRRCPAFAQPQAVEALFARAALCDGIAVVGAVDQAALLLLHAATGLGGDRRHLGDLAHWWHRAPVAPEPVAQTLISWRAALPAVIVAHTVRDHSREAPPPALLALIRLLPTPGWRADAATAAVGIARWRQPLHVANPQWAEALVAASVWPEANWRLLGRALVSRWRRRH